MKELIDVIKEFGVAVNDFFWIGARRRNDGFGAFGGSRRLGNDGSFHSGGLTNKHRTPTINFRVRKN